MGVLAAGGDPGSVVGNDEQEVKIQWNHSAPK